jgi:hypothetical protein
VPDDVDEGPVVRDAEVRVGRDRDVVRDRERGAQELPRVRIEGCGEQDAVQEVDQMPAWQVARITAPVEGPEA